jgi:hypothetical protein
MRRVGAFVLTGYGALCNSGPTGAFRVISVDHNTANADEVRRACDAGGFYSDDQRFGKRVNGATERGECAAGCLHRVAARCCVCVPAQGCL